MAIKKKSEREIISEAMGLLGKRTSEKKRVAVARNNAATRFKEKPLEALACTCGKCPDDPKTYCPRGRASIRRRAKQNGSENMATQTIESSNIKAEVVSENEDFATLAARRQKELHALMAASEAERQAAMKASAKVAAAYYATPEGREELADWRALQGEPFHE